MRRLAATIFAISLLIAPAALAEVFVQTGSHDEFVAFVMTPRVDRERLIHWQTTIKLPRRDYLNTSGDTNGDHPPASVLIPAGMLYSHPTPVVVWSQVDGVRNDLVFSLWREGHGWTSPVEMNQIGSAAETTVDLLADPDGSVHAIWGVDTPVQSIWYAKFAGGSWSIPERVSDASQDSRNPKLTQVANRLFISYEIWTGRPVVIRSFLKEDFD